MRTLSFSIHDFLKLRNISHVWHRNNFSPRYFEKKIENFDLKCSFGRNKNVEVEKRPKYSLEELKQYLKLTKAKLKNIELRKSVSVEIVFFQKDNQNHK